MQEIEIGDNRNSTISATIYRSATERAVLIIASATGVKQSFYTKFATYISSQGISVITFDYQGIGRSLKQNIKQHKNNAQEWGSVDLENVLMYALVNHPDSPKYLLGHSIGGQLIGLAPSSLVMDRIILVAAQTGYWKYWSGIERVKMWLNWYVVFPFFVRLFGYLPSKSLSGMENLPKNVALQWSKWGRNKEYLFSDPNLEPTYYNKIESALTAISIEDDFFAPKGAVDWMTQKYSSTNPKKIHISPKDYNTKKIGHFGIFKETFKNSLWKLLLQEMNEGE